MLIERAIAQREEGEGRELSRRRDRQAVRIIVVPSDHMSGIRFS